MKLRKSISKLSDVEKNINKVFNFATTCWLESIEAFIYDYSNNRNRYSLTSNLLVVIIY